MTYRIKGLPRSSFARFFDMDARELADSGAMRVIANADRGFPCRVSLEDARQGESLILLNYTSHDVANPYRTAYAIYVRECAGEPEPFVDTLPPVLKERPLSLRGFDREGLLTNALLTSPGQAEQGIAELFGDLDVAYIHAHNAAYGCFAARIDRHGDIQ
jgi:hypothetical protein